MRARFVHTADNHLGYEQYGVKERFNDFARAFLAIVEDAIARHADFFVIAGDLFNKRAIDARTLIQAEEGLQRLKDAGIPAIAIEGNHDRSYYRDGVSWLQFLCWRDLLILLDPVFKDGAPAAWSRGTPPPCAAPTSICSMARSASMACRGMAPAPRASWRSSPTPWSAPAPPRTRPAWRIACC